MFGISEVAGKYLGAALLVGLISTKYDGILGALVVFAGVFEGPGVNPFLKCVLLSIKEESNATLSG